MLIIVVVRFILSITAMSGLRAGITLSDCTKKSHNNFTSLFYVTGYG